MAKKIIRCALSVESINRAIREIEAYECSLARKAELLRNEVANRIAEIAGSIFNSSIADDTLSGPRYANVSVEVSKEGEVTLIIAHGKDAIFVEFGAGVYNNGPVGSSPHPEGERLGFTIGSYGEGNGRKNVWGYYEDGELVLTHGTPATMPMYTATKQVCGQIAEIAREVFAGD